MPERWVKPRPETVRDAAVRPRHQRGTAAGAGRGGAGAAGGPRPGQSAAPRVGPGGATAAFCAGASSPALPAALVMRTRRPRSRLQAAPAAKGSSADPAAASHPPLLFPPRPHPRLAGRLLHCLHSQAGRAGAELPTSESDLVPSPLVVHFSVQGFRQVRNCLEPQFLHL